MTVPIVSRPLQVVRPDEAAELRAGKPPLESVDGSDVALPTWRTLADISDEPPRDLILGMIEPDGRTLAYATPGTGKGSTGAWLATELSKSGKRVAVYDPERRPREWSRRVSGLGGERAAVTYFDPSDLGTKFAGVPIWDSIERIAYVVRETASEVLLIDSILSCLNLDERRLLNDPSVPFAYDAALATLAIPVLSFAHPPKGQPEGEPFGSLGWVAAHRLTWLGVRLPGDEHRVRWRVRKANERGHVPGILLSFGYGDDSRLVSAVREDDDESTRDWILGALRDGDKTLADLVSLEAEEAGEYLSAEAIERSKARLGKAVYRLKAQGWLSKAGKAGRAQKWALCSPGRP
ncbi:MAG TPA: hypothetical protein VGE81_05270 [Candidatus Limnocylindrales bacterium]|jgi:hypothetical protein